MGSRMMVVRRGLVLLVASLAIFAMLELIRRADNELISTSTHDTKEKTVVVQTAVSSRDV